jgi:hypothetical protein
MSVGRRDGAGRPDLSLHIGRVVVEPALLDGVGAGRVQWAEQIQAALYRRSAAEPASNELPGAADSIAHAIWARIKDAKA